MLSFTTFIVDDTVGGAYGVKAVDFDRDGRVDVLSAGRDDGTIAVHRQVAVDGFQYIALYPDLIRAFGAHAAAGRQHYDSFGRSEGRKSDDFDEAQYLTKYSDLQAAFGPDTNLATIPYIQYGFAENRSDILF